LFYLLKAKPIEGLDSYNFGCFIILWLLVRSL